MHCLFIFRLAISTRIPFIFRNKNEPKFSTLKLCSLCAGCTHFQCKTLYLFLYINLNFSTNEEILHLSLRHPKTTSHLYPPDHPPYPPYSEAAIFLYRFKNVIQGIVSMGYYGYGVAARIKRPVRPSFPLHLFIQSPVSNRPLLFIY